MEHMAVKDLEEKDDVCLSINNILAKSNVSQAQELSISNSKSSADLQNIDNAVFCKRLISFLFSVS